MADANFPQTAAKIKAKYENKNNKTNTISSATPSEDKYPCEKAVIDYVEELKDYIGSP